MLMKVTKRIGVESVRSSDGEMFGLMMTPSVRERRRRPRPARPADTARERERGDGQVEEVRDPEARDLEEVTRSSDSQATRARTARARTRAPSSHCSGGVYSSGEWLMPPLLGTKSIAAGT